MENELIEKAKAKVGSYASLARALGCSPQLVNEVKHGRAHFDPDTLGLLADLAGENCYEVLSKSFAERAKRDTVRRFWQGKAGALAGIALTSTLLLGVSVPTTGKAMTTAVGNPLYIMRTRRRRKARRSDRKRA